MFGPKHKLSLYSSCMEVAVFVYDLGRSVDGNRIYEHFGLGQWHTQVQVGKYQYTWAFPTGITKLIGPFSEENAKFVVGTTSKTAEDISTLLTSMSMQWGVNQYNMLTHSCNHFTQEFVRRVCDSPMYRHPGWIMRVQKLTGFISLTPRNKKGAAVKHGFPKLKIMLVILLQMLFVIAQAIIAISIVNISNGIHIGTVAVIFITLVGMLMIVIVSVLELKSVTIDEFVTTLAVLKILVNLLYLSCGAVLIKSIASGTLSRGKRIFITFVSCITIVYLTILCCMPFFLLGGYVYYTFYPKPANIVK